MLFMCFLILKIRLSKVGYATTISRPLVHRSHLIMLDRLGRTFYSRPTQYGTSIDVERTFESTGPKIGLYQDHQIL